MTRTELIAEITTDFKSYDETGLIDYRSLKQWIKSELKRFGNNIMIPTEKTVQVVNGRANLPDNFWRLLVAAKCEAGDYKIVEGEREHIVMSHAWKVRTEQSKEWDNNSEALYNKDHKVIKERVYFEGGAIEYYFKDPVLLRLTRGMRREVCHSSCKNLQAQLTSNSPNEINIVGDIIQANFTNGYIYLQYMALPSDESGELIIHNDSLQKYLIYYCKMKILENLIGNEDDPQKRTDLGYFAQRADESFVLAMTETKFDGLGHDWDVKLKNAMRKDTLKYELMFPN